MPPSIFAMLQPGDLILTMDLSHGGHLTHGHKMNFSGRFYRVVHYGVSKQTETIDYDALENQAKENPSEDDHGRARRLIRASSIFPRLRTYRGFLRGRYLFIDMAHIAGLGAAGVHPSPMPHADFVTTTTHKTLRGPRGRPGLLQGKVREGNRLAGIPGCAGWPADARDRGQGGRARGSPHGLNSRPTSSRSSAMPRRSAKG